MTFTEASDNCHEMSGKLFDFTDDVKNAIKLLLERMLPAETFWTGIRHSDLGDSWITQDGQLMDNFVNKPRFQPSNDENFLAMSYSFDEVFEPTNRNVFFPKRENETLPSVCYKISSLDYF